MIRENVPSEIVVSPGLSLVHDPSVHQGKTGGMAKGLFLKVGDRLCAGESAGIGLPVWKAGGRTYFPALLSVRQLNSRTLEKIFSMEKALLWRVGETEAPEWVSRALEVAVDGYMALPALQHCLLAVRDGAFSLLNVNSSLVDAGSRGLCTVTYEARPHEVEIAVDASELRGEGRLILLNEVDGGSFTRLRMEEEVREGQRFPAWLPAPFSASVESPVLGVAVSLGPGGGEEPSDFRLFCGREEGRMLDWSGFSLMCGKPVFSYRVTISDEVPVT